MTTKSKQTLLAGLAARMEAVESRLVEQDEWITALFERAEVLSDAVESQLDERSERADMARRSKLKDCADGSIVRIDGRTYRLVALS